MIAEITGAQRYRRILKAVWAGGASRVLAGSVGLLTLPLAVRYLGAERYGVWATVTTTAVWINLLDLGIANTLTNHISRAYAVEDREEARRYFTNALALTLTVCVLVAAVFSAVFHYVDWAGLLNVSRNLKAEEVNRTIAFGVGLVLLGLPANLGSKLLAGYQELHLNAYASATGAVASLIGLGLGILMRVTMPTLYLMSMGCITFASVGMLGLTIVRRPWLAPRLSSLDRSCSRQLLDSGSSFFLIQVAAAVVFSSDNIIVSHYLGAAEVTSYSVAWRAAGLAAMLQSLIFPALWPAYAEAYARRDYAWIRQAFAATMKGVVGLNLFCAFSLVVVGRDLIRVWVGAAGVPPIVLIYAMAIWIVVNGFMSMESCLLAALNRTRGQAILSISAAAVNVVLSIVLVRRIGAVGVISGTIASYLLVLIIPQTFIVRSVWRGDLLGVSGDGRASAADAFVRGQAGKSPAAYPTRNGLRSRSSPMVVSDPCPGTTSVSSGNASTGP